MYSFLNLEPVRCFMPSSNCCFLTYIQISQEAGEVVWYSHLLKNFPQFVVIHTVKGFSIANKADVFLEFSCFFDDTADVGNLISGSSAFSKSSLNIWKFTVHVLMKPGLENFEHCFTSVWDECNCAFFDHSLALTFFGIGMTSRVYSNFGRKFLSITQYCVVLSHFSCVWLFVTLWTIAFRALLSMGFSRQEYQNGLPCPPQGDHPDPRIQFVSLKSPALAGRFFTTELPEKPKYYTTLTQKNEKQNVFSPWVFFILKTLMPCPYQSEIFNLNI